MTITPGFHPQITAREYFAEPCPAPALTCSTIKALAYRTAAEAAYEHGGISPNSPAAKSTAVKRFGDVAHQLALGKGRGYAIGEYDAWMSKEAKAFKAEAEDAGLTPIKRKEYDAALASSTIMRDRIEHVLCMIGGTTSPPPYETELVFIWREDTPSGPIWCRGMSDLWCESLAIIDDPKFSPVLSNGAFETHAVKMGWDLQDAWYRRGIETIRPDLAGRVRFINTLVSPKPPHVSRNREADEATTYTVTPIIERAIKRFGACLAANEWTGYPTTIEPWTAKSYTMTERMMMAEED